MHIILSGGTVHMAVGGPVSKPQRADTPEARAIGVHVIFLPLVFWTMD